ncbi:zinc-dependent alcohol dehydrogenase family protein [Candidatus Bathyarchaeota archaeon]|nr:zinc-dependent alcohol dehydrogenase family protein [Candidatus Bathyarchaeota archaeon]
MKAAVLHDVRDIRVEEVKKPEIAEDEVLIEVKAAGICGTDLHFYKGEWKVDMPIIPGHEFSGVIAEVGENVDGFKIGEHVVAEPNITCGSCYFCLMSERNFFCENLKAVGVTVNGAFAEYLKIKGRNLYRIPENLSFEEAALIEPLACCIRGLDNVGIKAGESVLIVGAGPIGLLLMQLVRNFGASMIIQTDLEDYRLEKALELGADRVVNVRKEDPIKVIKELTGGYGVDVAIEAVGSPKAITQAVEAVRKGGRVNIFGVSPQDAVWQVKPFDLYSKELTITTSYRSPYTFQRAVKMASSGRLKLKPLISHIFPLEKIAEAFEILDKKLDNVMKVILKPS